MKTPNTQYNSLDDTLMEQLVQAYSGQAPMPIGHAQKVRAYAHYKGAFHQVILKGLMQSPQAACAVIPGLAEILSEDPDFCHKTLKQFNQIDAQAQSRQNLNIEALELLEKELTQKNVQLRNESLEAVEAAYIDSDPVWVALNAKDKQEWSQSLAKMPQNSPLLSATASLTSDDFFARGMHLVFMEVEPDIYGTLSDISEHAGFKAQCALRERLMLRFERQALQKLIERKQAEAPKPAPKQEEPTQEPAAKPVEKPAEPAPVASKNTPSAPTQKEPTQKETPQPEQTPKQDKKTKTEQKQSREERLRLAEQRAREAAELLAKEEPVKPEPSTPQKTQTEASTSTTTNKTANKPKLNVPNTKMEELMAKAARHAQKKFGKPVEVTKPQQEKPVDSDKENAQPEATKPTEKAAPHKPEAQAAEPKAEASPTPTKPVAKEEQPQETTEVNNTPQEVKETTAETTTPAEEQATEATDAPKKKRKRKRKKRKQADDIPETTPLETQKVNTQANAPEIQKTAKAPIDEKFLPKEEPKNTQPAEQKDKAPAVKAEPQPDTAKEAKTTEAIPAKETKTSADKPSEKPLEHEEDALIAIAFKKERPPKPQKQFAGTFDFAPSKLLRDNTTQTEDVVSKIMEKIPHAESLGSEVITDILNAASEMNLSQDSSPEGSSTGGLFLSKANPLKPKKKMTLQTIDLSSKK